MEVMSSRTLITTTLAYAFVGGLFLRSIPAVGVVQHIVMGVVLVGAWVALWRDWQSIAWLASGLFLRGVLSLVEAAAFWVELNGVAEPALRAAVGAFLSSTSSFDAGAEWFLALGCVLAVSDRAQRDLARTNQNLLFAQEHLRRLADRDPLTALDNRRALPEILRTVQPDGAVLLFFDLDGFKQINDRHGHAVGDGCLKRFAVAVRESFRPSDAVIRYGGDEFLVVATGLDCEGARDRVERLRVHLTSDPTGEPPIRFSCGLAELPPGGSPDAALHAADRAMYASKARV
jgi:diguanylate cyclase (GGDEF)-like protein